jgi:hypothetical protein
MHQAFSDQTIDRARNINGQDPGNSLSVVSHHQLIALGDSSEVLAQLIPKISDADFHDRPLWLH